MTDSNQNIEWSKFGERKENHAEWLQGIVFSNLSFNQKLANEYPQWVQSRYKEKLSFRYYRGDVPVLALLSGNQLKLVFRFESQETVRIDLVDPSAPEKDLLSKILTTAHDRWDVRDLDWYVGVASIRFKFRQPSDYELLKEITTLIYGQNYAVEGIPATIIDEPVDVAEEPESRTDTGTTIESVEKWLSSFENNNPQVRKFAADYPRWLEQEFGNKVERLFLSPNIKGGGELAVKVKGKFLQHVVFNRGKSYFYILLYDPSPEELETLRQNITWPTSLVTKTPYIKDSGDNKGYRLFIYTEKDYTLLKEVTRSMVERALTPAKLFEAAALNDLIERFNRNYDSFKSPKYLSLERNYKVEAGKLLEQQLNEEQLRRLIDIGAFGEAKERIKKVTRATNMPDIYSKSLITNAPEEPLARAFYEMLYGTAPEAQRFTAWIEALGSINQLTTKPGLWPLATYYWMLRYPDTHIFLKPNSTDAFLELCGSSLKRPTKPDFNFYQQYLELSRSLLNTLKPQGARDMIDVQSFIWVSNLESTEPVAPIGIEEEETLEVKPYEEPSFESIMASIQGEGLRITPDMLRRYHLALKTRGFVILSGVSGTGKTWLAQAYAQAVGAKALVVPVAPNWNSNEDLLGFYNPITHEYHHTDFSYFLKEASEAYIKAREGNIAPQPYHLILDEMNLARVEYYFAKFLSAMELRARKKEAALSLGTGEAATLGSNLYFIGTVNIDETTHTFADKVYDRAQLIQLGITRDQVQAHLGNVPYAELLLKIWDVAFSLAPFAFRTLDEIKVYVEEAAKLGIDWKPALDEQVLQKILPKLKGSDLRLGKDLKDLLTITQELPLTQAKVKEMHDGFSSHGFASFF